MLLGAWLPAKHAAAVLSAEALCPQRRRKPLPRARLIGRGRTNSWRLRDGAPIHSRGASATTCRHMLDSGDGNGSLPSDHFSARGPVHQVQGFDWEGRANRESILQRRLVLPAADLHKALSGLGLLHVILMTRSVGRTSVTRLQDAGNVG